MRKVILCITILSFALTSKGQYNWEYGFRAGGANYLGEIGGKDKPEQPWVMDMHLNQTRWNGGAFVRYKYNHRVSFAAGLNYLRLQGADSLTTYAPRRSRNLSFKNDVYELTLRTDYTIYTVNDVGGTGRYILNFSTYVFAGVGGFYNNPKAQYNGEWVALQPLQTEGKKYSKFQLTVPAGVGLFFTYRKKHRFGWEFNWRTTFTDYVDDASSKYADPSTFNDPISADLANRRGELPADSDELIEPEQYGPGSIRGDETDNDSYLTTTFYYSRVLRGAKSFYRSKYNYIYGGKRKRRRTRAKF